MFSDDVDELVFATGVGVCGFVGGPVCADEICVVLYCVVFLLLILALLLFLLLMCGQDGLCQSCSIRRSHLCLD